MIKPLTFSLLMLFSTFSLAEESYWNKFKGDASEAWKNAKEGASDMAESATEAGKSGWDKTKDLSSDAVSNTSDFASSTWDKAKEKASEIAD